jgi:hypothetical protein
VNGRNFEIEQFNLLEDLGPWIELEVEQRTGQKVTPKKVDGGGFDPPGAEKPEAAVKKPVPAASSSGAPKAAPPASAKAP